MQLLEGIEWLESTAMLSGNRNCFLRLNKALYGLQQAPKLWHQEIDSFLQLIRFHHSHADISLYTWNDGVLILLYIDDILVFYAQEVLEKALEVKQWLILQYKISNLRLAKQFLGLKIDRLADGSINVEYRVTGYYPVVGYPATPGPTSKNGVISSTTPQIAVKVRTKQ